MLILESPTQKVSGAITSAAWACHPHGIKLADLIAEGDCAVAGHWRGFRRSETAHPRCAPGDRGAISSATLRTRARSPQPCDFALSVVGLRRIARADRWRWVAEPTLRLGPGIGCARGASRSSRRNRTSSGLTRPHVNCGCGLA